MSSSRKAIAILTLTAVAASVAWLAYTKKKRDNEESIETRSSPDNNLEQRTALAEAARSKGNKFYTDKKIDEAIACYTESITLYPRNHNDLRLAFANRAACHLLKNEFGAVIEDCNEALKFDPYFLKALDRRSRAMESLGNFEEAFVDATAAVLIDDFKTESLSKRIDSLVASYSQRMTEKFSGEFNRELPNNMIMTEFIESFAQELAELRALAASAADADLLKLVQYLEAGDWDNADVTLSLLFQKVRQDSSRKSRLILSWFASFAFLKGDLETSHNALARILDVEPSNAVALIKMALIRMEVGDFGQAYSYLKTAENGGDLSASFYFYHGELLAIMGNMEAACNEFSEALSKNKNLFQAIARKVRCLLNTGSPQEALEYLLQVKKETSKLNPEIELCLAEIHALCGNPVDANMGLDDLEKSYPNFAPAYFTRGLLFLKVGKSDEAERCLEKSISIDPGYLEATLQLAGLCANQNRIEEAERYFDSAIKAARTQQQLSTIFSLKAAALSQARVCERYPELKAKITQQTGL